MHTSPARRLRAGLAVATCTAAAALVPLHAAPAGAAPLPHRTTVTVRAAIDGQGGQTNGTNSYEPVLSSNGRFLAYEGGPAFQAYVIDLLSGQARLASTNSSGTVADQPATPVDISTDGNRVAFVSNASNLAPAPHGSDLYVRDLAKGTTTRANLVAGGTEDALAEQNGSMDAAGDAVAWTDHDQAVWTRNLTTGTAKRIDVSPSQAPANDIALAQTRITPDGKHVVFTSFASNLVTGDSNGFSDVFERNLSTGITVRASVSAAGTQLAHNSEYPSASADGRDVAFVYDGTDATPGANGDDHIYLRDLTAGTTERISVATGGAVGNGNARQPQVSADGHAVVFRDDATNLAAGTPAGRHTFVRNRTAATTALVDRTTSGTISSGDTGSDSGSADAISGDGSVVAFESNSPNLVGGDTNARSDVFARVLESSGPRTTLGATVADVTSRFAADPSTVAATTARVTNGQLTIAHLIATDAHAAAWAKDREPVTRLYTSFFRREPDLGGLTHWVNKHATGTDLGPIATQFARSSEFKTKFGSVSNGAFVTLVYQHVLDRDPDAAGLAHWTEQLDHGVSRGQVMVQFSESTEGKRHLAPQVDATLIGLGLLQRMPTTAEFTAEVKAYSTFTVGGDESEAEEVLDSAGYAASI